MNSTTDFLILIADPVLERASELQSLLNEDGYSFEIAGSRSDIPVVCREHTPSLIILAEELIATDKSAADYEFVQQLKSHPTTEFTPVITIYNATSTPARENGYKAGINEYIGYPYCKQEIKVRVQHYYDLFNLKRVRIHLQNTLETKDSLHAAISRDLRAPLGTLRTMHHTVLNMADEKKIGKDTYAVLQTMNHHSEELYLFVDNLIKTSRYQLNNYVIYKQLADINSIIYSVVNRFSTIAAYQSISISYEESSELLTGYVDIDIVKTILNNLLSNAVKNSFEGSLIHVKMAAEPDSVTITIEDSGVGLANDLLEKLSTLPPMQPCIAPSDEERLPGLGLLLSRQLASLHAGFLKVTQEEGKGTVYILNLNTEPTEEEEED